MDTMEAIRSKRETRFYLDRPIPEEVIRLILDAGRLSGSSKNTQPWHFVAVRDRERVQALSQCGRFTQHLIGAALVVVLVMPGSGYQSFDAGRAAQNMMLAAWSRGVGSCPVYFHAHEQVRELLKVPADRYTDMAIGFGYPNLDREEEARGFRRSALARQGRRPLSEVAFWDEFGGQPVG